MHLLMPFYQIDILLSNGPVLEIAFIGRHYPLVDRTLSIAHIFGDFL